MFKKKSKAENQPAATPAADNAPAPEVATPADDDELRALMRDTAATTWQLEVAELELKTLIAGIKEPLSPKIAELKAAIAAREDALKKWAEEHLDTENGDKVVMDGHELALRVTAGSYKLLEGWGEDAAIAVLQASDDERLAPCLTKPKISAAGVRTANKLPGGKEALARAGLKIEPGISIKFKPAPAPKAEQKEKPEPETADDEGGKA